MISDALFWSLLAEGAVMIARASIGLLRAGAGDGAAWLQVRRAMLHITATIDKRFGRTDSAPINVEGAQSQA